MITYIRLVFCKMYIEMPSYPKCVPPGYVCFSDGNMYLLGSKNVKLVPMFNLIYDYVLISKTLLFVHV